MRRLIFTLLLGICCLCLHAQELKFLGIPVNGTITTMHEKLCKEKHFHPTVEGDWFNNYTGFFFGRDVTMKVVFVPTTKEVASIDVTFPERGSHAVKMYATLVKQLDKKYGASLYSDDKSSGWSIGTGYHIHLAIKDADIVTLQYKNEDNTNKWSKVSFTTEYVTSRFAKYCEDL